MWLKAISVIAASLALSASAFVAPLRAQEAGGRRPNRPAAGDERPSREATPVTAQPAEAGCEQQMARAYEGALAYLNATPAPSAEELGKAASAASGIEAFDLAVSPLGRETPPDFFVGCSCHADVSDARATFRVFKAVERGYVVAARSEDFAILSTPDRDGTPVEAASLEVAALMSNPARAASSHFATTWTRSGGRPAPVSVVVWEWNGQALQPVWSKLDLRGRDVDVVGGIIAVSGGDEEGAEADEAAPPDAFRVADGAVVYDGKLDAALLKKYADEKIIAPHSTEDYTRLAALWHGAGDAGQAIALYEKAIAAGKRGQTDYLYLLVAELHEARGEFKQAARSLEAYGKASQGRLTPQGREELNGRIRTLRERREQ